MPHDTTTYTMPLDTPVGRLVLESDGDVLIGIWLPSDPNACTAAPANGDDAPPVLKDDGDPARGVLRRRAARSSTCHGARRHRLPARGLGRAGRIPYGETISYGELARRVGRPTGPGPSARPTGGIPSPSSCRATASGRQRHRRLRGWPPPEAAPCSPWRA